MEFNFDKFISMTELQKISSKKLKRLGTPLVVLNRKSKKGGFVILDLEKFDEMEKGGAGLQPVLKRQARQAKETPDFRGMGLLWDRPEMSNRAFYKKLKDPFERDHAWAAKRFLEYAPSRAVTSLLSLEEIKELLSKTSLRFGLKEAWQNAVHYWSQSP